MLAQTGEFLAFDNNQALQLQPMLATSWKPSKGGAVWTFSLRQGVKFHDGCAAHRRRRRLHDAAAVRPQDRLQRAVDVRRRAQARRASSRSTPAPSPSTSRPPNGNFPYLVSSDNYNAIIVPKGTDFGKWQKTFIGTGPFKLGSYTQNVRARTSPPTPTTGAARRTWPATAFTFYTSQQPQILALQGGQVDVIVQFVVQGAQSLLNNSQYNIIKLKSANHRELSMRNDQAPFTDPRVRQAIALSPGPARAWCRRCSTATA